MGQITIRGIAPEVEQEIRKISRITGKSLNRVIQDIICQHTGHHQQRRSTPTAALKKLAGGWSKKEAADFMESIKSCEQIDPGLWQ